MCGFFTVLGDAADHYSVEALLAISEKLKHRGPDGEGFGYFNSSNFGKVSHSKSSNAQTKLTTVSGAWVHRRLSLQDKSDRGLQPFISADQRYGVVYNGEIYNFRSLRNELAALNHEFQTDCDTEVLLTGWVEWGVKLFDKLRGMYAFVIIDYRNNEVIFSRDQFGIKPLYFSVLNNSIFFCSELPALLLALKSAGLKPSLCQEGIKDFLKSKGMTDAKTSTLVDDIYIVPPGTFARISLNKIYDRKAPDISAQAVFSNLVKFWELPKERSVKTPHQAAEILRETFLDSVKHHYVADFPVVTTLSGGIDSSALLGALRYILGEKEEITCFGITMPNHEDIDETKYMRHVADFNGATLIECPMQGFKFQDILLDAMVHQGEPFVGLGVFAQNHLFGNIKRHGFKAVMGGQGADEQLAGYGSFLGVHISQLCRNDQWQEIVSIMRFTDNGQNSPFPSMLIRIASELAIYEKRIGEPGSASRLVQKFPELKAAREFVRPPIIRTHSTLLDFIDVTSTHQQHAMPEVFLPNKTEFVSHHQHLRFNTGLQKLLRYEDRNAMQYSIENRVPFLDREFTEAVYQLPTSVLIDSTGLSKAAFRNAFKDLMPNEVYSRREKLGFSTPSKDWFSLLRPRIAKAAEFDFSQWSCVTDPNALSAAMRHSNNNKGLAPAESWLVTQLVEFSRRYFEETSSH